MMIQANSAFASTVINPLAGVARHFTYTHKPGLHQYILAINPSYETKKIVLAEKQEFAQTFQQPFLANQVPFIAIAEYVATEQMEETIARWVQRICAMQQSFSIMLNNFSGIPPHTIYLRVQYPQLFAQLANQLRVVDAYVREYGFPPITFQQNPHVAIATHLPGQLYLKAMLQYSQKDFNTSFQATELVLLKRKTELDNWEKINMFRLSESQNEA